MYCDLWPYVLWPLALCTVTFGIPNSKTNSFCGNYMRKYSICLASIFWVPWKFPHFFSKGSCLCLLDKLKKKTWNFFCKLQHLYSAHPKFAVEQCYVSIVTRAKSTFILRRQLCNPHFSHKCCHFRWNQNKVSENDNTFGRNEDCTTVFLKWTDFTKVDITSCYLFLCYFLASLQEIKLIRHCH